MHRNCTLLLLLFFSHANNIRIIVQALALIHRRQLLRSLLTVPVATTASPVSAMCTWGDESEDCIGVYKIPATNGASVDPSTARSTLIQQRQRIDNIKLSIRSGHLQQGGLELLKVVPKITSAGKALIFIIQKNNGTGNSVVAGLRMQQMESLLEEMTGLLGQVDVSIGQGMRGEMGSITMAQLTILKDLQEAQNLVDDFVAMSSKE